MSEKEDGAIGLSTIRTVLRSRDLQTSHDWQHFGWSRFVTAEKTVVVTLRRNL